MRFLRCFSQYSLCSISLVLTILSESTVVFGRFHIFQLQLCCAVKAVAGDLAQRLSRCVKKTQDLDCH